jgi:hypothetical protein
MKPAESGPGLLVLEKCYGINLHLQELRWFEKLSRMVEEIRRERERELASSNKTS